MIPVLPIQQHIPEIKKALDTSKRAVVQAPPGAGKTTHVPPALLNEPWLNRKKIILLEPRRLAARSCAAYMAGLLNEKVGQTVGYRIRMDRKTGPDTRIEVVTEGIFTRKIQNDPSLEEVGLVIFDEFHERNIHSDLGLALCLESSEILRDDLRVLVMSATMDVASVSALMDDAPVIVSKGKSFPVETIYVPDLKKQGKTVPVETACTSIIKRVVSETHDDILVFLPGVREILRTKSQLDKNLDPGCHVIPLYGNLSQKDQGLAFSPSKPGGQKIVLATSIAETSVTIDGIRVVIDSGLMRVPRFSPRTGMSLLMTIPVSKASADQRRGRAGRTAPGKCYRLWSEHDHQSVKPFTRPEILSVDLAGMALELALWGVTDPGLLKWFDPPEKPSFENAVALLKTLKALDHKGRITPQGKKMASVGLHPRLAHMIIKGEKLGQGALACRIAAFLNERDFIRFNQYQSDPDIRLRLDIIEQVANQKKISQANIRIDNGIVHRMIKSEKKLMKNFGIKPCRTDNEMAGRLIAHAYPDRIAQKRNNKENMFLMASGKGAFFSEVNTVSINEYIVGIHLDGNPRNARIFLAAPYLKQDLALDFSKVFQCVETIKWDKKTTTVQAAKETRFGALVIDQELISDMDTHKACAILCREIRKKGLGILPWTKKLVSLKERAVFLKSSGRFPDLPDVSDSALEKQMDTWLAPFLTGVFSLKQLGKMDLGSAFSSLLTWKQQQTIEKNAPTHIIVPSGSKLPLTYSSETGLLDSPILEVRLQEMFGLNTTPGIAGSTIPICLHLLSPAGRPVQITKDLESFWKNTYDSVKKDLMGRYPKHFWPDNPLSARPTNRAKPRKR